MDKYSSFCVIDGDDESDKTKVADVYLICLLILNTLPPCNSFSTFWTNTSRELIFFLFVYCEIKTPEPMKNLLTDFSFAPPIVTF